MNFLRRIVSKLVGMLNFVIGIDRLVLTLWTIRRVARRLNERVQNFSKPTKEWAWVVFVAYILSFEACVEGLVDNSEFAWRIPLEFILALAGLRATRESDEPLEYYK